MDLVIHKLHFLVYLLHFLQQFLLLNNLLVQFANLRGESFLLFPVSMHLEFVQLLSPVLVLLTQVVDLPLVLAHSHQQLRVRLLSRQELVHNFLHVRETSAGFDSLESVLHFESPLHFLFHLFL